MKIGKLLARLEAIKCTLLDSNGNQWMIEGVADDINVLMDDINSFGVEDEYGVEAAPSEQPEGEPYNSKDSKMWEDHLKKSNKVI